jgi:hypothetical protein
MQIFEAVILAGNCHFLRANDNEVTVKASTDKI